MGAGLSPFPYALIFPQDEHERLLIERLARGGRSGRARNRAASVSRTRPTACVARASRRPTASVETCEAAYIAGCDGAHSTVREALGIGFPGGTYAHLFYVADVEARWRRDERRAARRPRHDRLSRGLPAEGRGPRAAHRHGARRGRRASTSSCRGTTSARVSSSGCGIDVKRVNWFSTYRVHHRVADRFRSGRAFLLGDAAHIHSPVGGQGMNTGIGDAVNLAWKLAAVLHGRATASLLDTYEPERIAFARRLVATTDRAFTGVTSTGADRASGAAARRPVVVPPLVRAPERAAGSCFARSRRRRSTTAAAA